MFWDKKTDQKPSAAPADNSVPPTMADPALDATGELLRIWGKYAFDLDQLSAQTIKELCQKREIKQLALESSLIN